jgi:hypothetical protein
MQFEIRSDIPLPQHRRGSGRKRKIPLDKLKLRECVVHPGGPIRASAAASYANRTMAPKRFTVRALNGGRAGIWRIR